MLAFEDESKGLSALVESLLDIVSSGKARELQAGFAVFKLVQIFSGTTLVLLAAEISDAHFAQALECVRHVNELEYNTYSGMLLY